MNIGHVHLRVADLDRSLAFYRDTLGLELQGRIDDMIAFLAVGDHQHLAISTFDSAGGEAPARGTTGLHHVAFVYPDRATLAAAARTVADAITHGADHGANEAVYLSDPDGNGVELYWERPRAEWPRTPDGKLAMINLPLDVEALLSA
jgi:catechol 2,3-dioxygenase